MLSDRSQRRLRPQLKWQFCNARNNGAARLRPQSSRRSQREVSEWEVGGLKVEMTGDDWDPLKLQL